MDAPQNTNPNFYTDIRDIILGSRDDAIQSVEYQRMVMYWHLGERIFVDEQLSQDRAIIAMEITSLKALQGSLKLSLAAGFHIASLLEHGNFTVSILHSLF